MGKRKGKKPDIILELNEVFSTDDTDDITILDRGNGMPLSVEETGQLRDVTSTIPEQGQFRDLRETLPQNSKGYLPPPTLLTPSVSGGSSFSGISGPKHKPSRHMGGRRLSDLMQKSDIQTIIAERISRQLKRESKKLQKRNEACQVFMAILVGLTSGGLITAWTLLWDYLTALSLKLNTAAGVPLAAIPVMGGILIAVLRFFVKELGPPLKVLNADLNNLVPQLSGVPSTVKFLGSAITLGTGNSMGPEGPCVEFGAIVSLVYARWFLTLEEYRPFMAAGVSAGLAAGFNAPISAVFFALEVVLKQTRHVLSVTLIMISAVLSTAIKRSVYPDKAKFIIPDFTLIDLVDLPHFMLLGIFGGLTSVWFLDASNRAQWLFHEKLNWVPRWVKPIIGSGITSTIAILYPEVMFFGYGDVTELMTKLDTYTWTNSLWIASIVPFKIFCTCVAVASGMIGGVFAPTIYIGGLMGTAYGLVLHMIRLGSAVHLPEVPAFALVGMASVVGGACNCPFTSLVLLFEMTRNYQIILPLIVSVGLSYWVTTNMNALLSWLGSDHGIKNSRKSQISLSNMDRSMMKQISVSTVMARDPLVVNGTIPIVKCGRTMTDEHHRRAVVLDSALSAPVGVIELDRVIEEVVQVEAEMQSAFRLFDSDNSGDIDKDEMEQFLRGVGISAEEKDIEELIELADVDGDGKINYSEFVTSAEQLGINIVNRTVASVIMSDRRECDPNFTAGEEGLTETYCMESTLVIDAVKQMMEANITLLPVIKRSDERVDAEAEQKDNRNANDTMPIMDQVVGVLSWEGVKQECSIVAAADSLARASFF